MLAFFMILWYNMLTFKGEDYMMRLKRERNLFILDVIGCIVSMIALFLLMFIMAFVETFVIVFVTALFIYVVFQLLGFLDGALQFMKQRKIKKYSGSKVSVMKYNYLVW